MAQLTDTRVEVTDTETTRSVDFETDRGVVAIADYGDEQFVEVNFEDVSAAEGREILDAVCDSEHFGERAEELAREILAAIDGGADADDEDEGAVEDEECECDDPTLTLRHPDGGYCECGGWVSFLDETDASAPPTEPVVGQMGRAGRYDGS